MTSKKDSKYCLANFIVISTIPILFFLSLIAGYLGVIHLNVPIHSISIIAFILFVFLLFISHNANYSVCKMKLDYHKMELQLNKKLKENTLKINNNSKSILDIDKFLQKYYLNIRNDNFVSVASSIFPMLGILGTFTAIAISMPNFSVTDTKALDNEISILLSGIGSAFFASIYGILLSLIWTYFEKRGLSKIDKYFQEIKTNFEDKIYSDEELLLYKYTQKDINEDKFVTTLKETFNLEFVKELNQLHLDSLKDIMNETNRNFNHTIQNVNIASKNIQVSSKELDNTISKIENLKDSFELRKEFLNYYLQKSDMNV